MELGQVELQELPVGEREIVIETERVRETLWKAEAVLQDLTGRGTTPIIYLNGECLLMKLILEQLPCDLNWIADHILFFT